jgi:hypothetical protein
MRLFVFQLDVSSRSYDLSFSGLICQGLIVKYPNVTDVTLYHTYEIDDI